LKASLVIGSEDGTGAGARMGATVGKVEASDDGDVVESTISVCAQPRALSFKNWSTFNENRAKDDAELFFVAWQIVQDRHSSSISRFEALKQNGESPAGS
jgi:hypothetical protein